MDNVTDTRTFTFEGTVHNPDHPEFGGAPAFTTAVGLDEARATIDAVLGDMGKQRRQVLALAGTYGVVFQPDDVPGTLAAILDRVAVDAGVAVHNDEEVIAITRTA
ncbi:hypothetical protein M3G04_04640 [Dietzia cinnamea]|uniref:hypothetical protein n=1 Tax=Dietzia cinnamea TaxID=321318 RepID=UPI00223C40A0|nr:hypothetical protein [Dietzia cinnamea]MCT2300191.1 hypothetical protein [Dietzia cinnamea]